MAKTKTRRVEPPPQFSDDDPPSAGVEERFKWRGSPELTFSDWTIEIVTNKEKEEATKGNGKTKRKRNAKRKEEAETVTTYHVHKCDLAYGARKSEYFANLFQSQFKESDASLSRIELDPLAASAFPALLDYIYAERPLEINTNTATALHYLGDYFQIHHLRWDARQFCRQNMSLGNIDIYYEHATLFQNETILDILAEFVKSNVLKIAPAATIVRKAEPKFWVRILKAPPIEDEAEDLSAYSLHWSKLVAEIGALKDESMDKETFEELTDISYLPTVHQEAALSLSELDDKVHADSDAENNSESNALQKRCAAAISQKWEELASATADVSRKLEQRKPSFLAHLLVQSMGNAKTSLAAYKSSLASANASLCRTQAELRLLKEKFGILDEKFNMMVPIPSEEYFGSLSSISVNNLPTDLLLELEQRHPLKQQRFHALVNFHEQHYHALAKEGKKFLLFYYDPNNRK